MIFKKIGFFNKFLNIIIRFIDFFNAKNNISALIILKRFLISFNAELIFLIEDADWAIKWVGKYITFYLNKLELINAEIDRRYALKNRIIHYGSINCIIQENAIIKVDESNKHILTFFHVSSDDYYIRYIPYLKKKIDLVHTPNYITKKKLIELGFEPDKIVVIPLGIDLSIFKNFNQNIRKKLREKFKLPKDKIIIGSFQKDGIGWEEGLEPKLVKGPDILCEVIRQLAEYYDIHVFLTSPARGYVKKKLEEFSIPYTHIIFEDYLEMVTCYNCLDLYIITSRVEGGPLALLECMATGVPIVTTRVGMVPEVIKNNINGFIADLNDVDQLVHYSKELIENKELRIKIINNGLKIIQNYNWENISRQYYDKLYKRFFNK